MEIRRSARHCTEDQRTIHFGDKDLVEDARRTGGWPYEGSGWFLIDTA